MEIIVRRYELRAITMTSSLQLEDGWKRLGDVPYAAGIPGRFPHHAYIATITGESYRLKDQACKKEKE